MQQLSRRVFLATLTSTLLAACTKPSYTSPLSPTLVGTAAAIAPVSSATNPSRSSIASPSATLTATPRPATRTSISPSPATLIPGGLGLSREEWERRHGSPDKPAPVNGGMTYEQRAYHVLFSSLSQNVFFIEWTHPEGTVVILETARKQGLVLLPTDATFLRTFEKAKNGQRFAVDLYMSASLKEGFPGEGGWMWYGETTNASSPPGTCTIWCEILPDTSSHTGDVRRIAASTGLLGL